MPFRTSALHALRHALAQSRSRRAVVGLDGFVDTIVTPVARRSGQGEAFTPIRTLTEFGQRIAAAAGKSTNIELYPRLDKLGGNGPIMAHALLSQGAAVTYIGALGVPAVHPVFAPLAAHARVHSLTSPAHTTAVEFTDGKLMLGQMRSLDDVTFDRILAVMGADGLRRELESADLLALVNWTMLPNMTAILERLVEDVLPRLTRPPGRMFFDLADPEKRSAEDLRGVLGLLRRFEAFGRVTLGLNLKEAQQATRVLDLPEPEESPESLRNACRRVRESLGIHTVVIHPRASAACATPDTDGWVPGPYVEQPLITTGAGDHFNAGFTTGQALGLPPEACLTLGVSTSGHYVRTGHSPSLAEIETFLANPA